MEPWDGPAAIAATDNEWIIAAQDRNGLRPLRYTITKDKLLFAGSETGMIPLEEDRIIFKGRLGPGKIIGVHLDKGKIYYNNCNRSEVSNHGKKYLFFNCKLTLIQNCNCWRRS